MHPTRFVGLDVHKQRISVSVADSGRRAALEYLGEIDNEPSAISKLCLRLARPGVVLSFAMGRVLAGMAFIVSSSASAIDATWWRRCLSRESPANASRPIDATPPCSPACIGLEN